MITKIQKLSAIHNMSQQQEASWLVVYDYKDTKIVSNSQLATINGKTSQGCLWLQRYKNCQQFTTWEVKLDDYFLLFMITKIQKLSAIHNWAKPTASKFIVVYDYKDTKIVSNSQLHKNKKTKVLCCLWLQRYKNCQQFTTNTWDISRPILLFMITKIQKLSAIHN